MSEYKSIKGKTVQFLGTDPSDTGAEGQVWYNSTAGAFKSVVANEAWSSGAPTNGARRTPTGTGIQTAALAIGGGGGDGPSTEEYNGSGWSFGGTLGTGRYAGGAAGTQIAGLFFGGSTPGNNEQSATEEYDGSTWTAGGALNQARQRLGGTGTQTAGLAFTGIEYVPTTNTFTNTEEYDGTSWTTGGAVNTARQGLGSAGTQTAGLAFGGGPPITNATEEYDGSSWSVQNNLSTARDGLSGNGIQTQALGYGGETAPGPLTAATEAYDGTSWSNKPSLGTARRLGAGAGASSSSGLYAAGYIAGDITLTEEYNSSINVITAGAWASGPSVNNSRLSVNNGLGPTSASLIFAGNPGTAPYASTGTEEYDGSSWTTGGNTPAQASHYSGAAGTQTAAIGFANSDGGSLLINYDGSTWSVNPSSFPGTSNGSGTGESNSAIYAGYSGTNSLEWDGASWTAGGTMNTSRTGHGTGFGNTSSAIFATGSTGPSSVVTADSEEYDGTTWTSVGNVNTARRRLAASRPLSSASGYIFGGVTPTNNFSPAYTNTESWNGTNWSTSPNLAVGTSNQFGAGTTDAFNISGHSTALTAATEIFNPETTTLNIKTLTTS